MQATGEATYTCALCSQSRAVAVDAEAHRDKIKSSPNGLIEYSDIHYCFDGMLTIYNLHVDSNFHVRSFSLIELPEKRKSSIKASSIPLPSGKSGNSLNYYNIDRMDPHQEGYRIVITDTLLRVKVNIGRVQKSEEPEATIMSKDENVQLNYYSSEKQFHSYHIDWFQHLVNGIEKLPPTKLGLFIETLRFVLDHHNQSPTDFEVSQLEIILSSHKTYFELIPVQGRYKRINSIAGKYGEEKKETLQRIFKLLEKEPDIALNDLILKLDLELVYAIFLFLILENEGLLLIKKRN